MAEDWPRSSEDRDFESARERIYGHATSSRDGRQALLAAFLGLSVFLLVLALSTRQTTASGPAQRLISAGVAVTTDVDQLLADEREPIRQLAQNSSAQAIPVPGYPLEVFLTRDEALNATTPELRAVILQRSSALVYTQGLGAFDRTGHQSISRFSAQGMIDFAVGELSADTHGRASLGTAIFALTTALAVCGVLATNHGWRRLRTLGIGVLIGALPGLLLFILGWFAIGSAGGSDAYAADLREIAKTSIMVPLRNFGIVSALGAVLTATAVAMGRLDGREAELDDDVADDEADYQSYSASTGT